MNYDFYIILFFLILFFIIFIINYILKKNNYESFNEINGPSIHVLLATMGKDSVFVILDSLKKQLKKNDYITIVFDGPNLPNIDKVKELTTEFKCNTTVIVEKKNLGFWGHAIRNKHNKLAGDFVFHVDDDDDITPNSINIIKNNCKDKNTIYIFKIDLGIYTIWKTKKIIFGEISTQMGLIPTKINPTSKFLYKYGGDYDFYKKLEDDGNNIEYIDKLIYLIRPDKR